MLTLTKTSFSGSVDLERTNLRGHTPFQVACACGRIDKVEFLLTEYPSGRLDINLSRRFDETALKIATSCGHVDILARLLQEGADVDTEVTISALFQAVDLDLHTWLSALCCAALLGML